MADEIDHIQPGHALLLEVVHRVRVLLAKDRHQDVGPCYFLLAVGSGLDMHDGALAIGQASQLLLAEVQIRHHIK